jgi:ribose transport system permease protein
VVDQRHETVVEDERRVVTVAPLKVLATAIGYGWRQLYNYGLLFALVLVAVVFSVLRPEAFPTTRNLGSILTGSAPLTLIALAVMLPLIVNQFDLTPGYMATLAGLLAVGLQAHQNFPVWLAALGTVVICCLVGLLNGVLVAVAKLNSLIVTLAVGSALFGTAELYSGGATIYLDAATGFTKLGQTRLFGIVPLPFVYAAAVAIIIWYILEYRPVGRFLYAIGGSDEGARLIGIRVDRLTVMIFVGSGFLASLGGVVQASRVGSANPTGVQALLLPAFTAAFLGTTSIRPGAYNVWGTVLAVYLVGTTTTGMFMLGAPSYWADIFNGVILLFAIGLAKISARRIQRLTDRNAVAGAGTGAGAGAGVPPETTDDGRRTHAGE